MHTHAVRPPYLVRCVYRGLPRWYCLTKWQHLKAITKAYDITRYNCNGYSHFAYSSQRVSVVMMVVPSTSARKRSLLRVHVGMCGWVWVCGYAILCECMCEFQYNNNTRYNILQWWDFLSYRHTSSSMDTRVLLTCYNCTYHVISMRRGWASGRIIAGSCSLDRPIESVVNRWLSATQRWVRLKFVRVQLGSLREPPNLWPKPHVKFAWYNFYMISACTESVWMNLWNLLGPKII